jgi:hypothetical protein
MFGNIAKVKKSGNVQKLMPRIIIKKPFIANINLELPMKIHTIKC